jgi:hypothetical protein
MARTARIGRYKNNCEIIGPRDHHHVMKHEEVTQDIIGAAISVLNELKPDLDEKL